MAEKVLYETTPPTAEQTQLITAAYILAGPKAEYSSYAQWREEFDFHLRDLAIAARESRNRKLVDRLLSMEATKKPFWAVVRGIGFHENSQRYVVQLETEDRETGELKIEYINTERTDSGNGDFIAGWIESELLGRRVRIHKHNSSRGQLNYKEIIHIEPGGQAEELSAEEAEDLAAELEEHIDSLGSSRR